MTKGKSFSIFLSIRLLTIAAIFASLWGAFTPKTGLAATTDIIGPAGSVAFGTYVEVLPNGNIVVIDTDFTNGAITKAGAVYLYDGATLSLISTLVGTHTDDQVGMTYWGFPSLSVLSNGNFVVVSGNWDGKKGAATLCSATTGCNGPVSTSNSLLGSTPNDQIGLSVYSLAGGAYLVASSEWDNGSATDAGALTYCPASGCTGTISASNSLVGGSTNDRIGFSVTKLSTGEYVAYSSGWSNGSTAGVGAVTGCPATGCTGLVSTTNSLVGTTAGDNLGTQVTDLGGGKYTVGSIHWRHDGKTDAGAVTFCGSIAACNGQVVSKLNSLYGDSNYNTVGFTTKLPDGGYVVNSSSWTPDGSTNSYGAVTRCPATGCLNMAVSASNSLVGTHKDDYIGGVSALPDSSYVVYGGNWNGNRGMAAYCPTAGCTGAVSTANSLTGSVPGDRVGSEGVLVYSDTSFIVRTSTWTNGALANAGAITFCTGSSCNGTQVSTTNSLYGTHAGDRIGWGANFGDAVLLDNHSVVIVSPDWNDNRGAVTLCDDTANICVGQPVSAANSMVGVQVGDKIGTGYYFVAPLPGGKYLVDNAYWSNGATLKVGAATLCSGSHGCNGQIVSFSNSLHGINPNDQVGGPDIGMIRVQGYADGYYSVWSGGFDGNRGAMTLCPPTGCLDMTVSAENSVLGGTVDGGDWLTSSYDATNHRLVVGRTLENMVSIHTAGPVTIDTTTALTSPNGNQSVYGEEVTFTATVTPQSGEEIPGGSVSFKEGAADLCKDVALVNGAAECKHTFTALSTHSISAAYSGDDDFNASVSETLTQTVNKAEAMLVVTPGKDTAVFGEPVSIDVTVQPVLPASGTPGGMVQILVNGNNEGSPQALSSGHKQFSLNQKPVAVYAITATYAGDANFKTTDSSQDPKTLTISNADTHLALVTSGTPSVNGQSVTFSATLSAPKPSDNGLIALADITFKDGANLLGTVQTDVNGVASWTGSTLSLGSHTISAEYAGAENQYNSTSAQEIMQQVNPADVTIALDLDRNSSVYGEPVGVSLTVDAKNPATGTPTGSIQLIVDGNNFGAPLNLDQGKAMTSLDTLVAGSHAITAAYAGDANFNLADTHLTPKTLVVALAASHLDLVGSGSPSSYFDDVSFTATLSAAAPSAIGKISGVTIDFKDGNQLLGSATTGPDGVASFTTNELGGGAHTIKAEFAGIDLMYASTSAQLTQTVEKAGVEITITPNGGKTSLVGYKYTVEVTVTSPTGTPSGMVTVTEGANTCSFDLSIANSCQLDGPTTGQKTIKAEYSGDANYAGDSKTENHSINYWYILLLIYK